MKPWELIDHIADLVVADSPRVLVERMFEALLAFANGRRAALFEREQGTVRLFASRGVDQAALDLVAAVWSSHRDSLLAGTPFSAARPSEDPALRGALTEAVSLAVLPVTEGEHVLGLLYVDSGDQRLTEPRELQTATQFARIAATVLARPRSGSAGAEEELRVYVERTPLEEIARDQLLALLERHEWNISRVARVLGVTRPTVYNRLERYGIERRKLRQGEDRQPA